MNRTIVFLTILMVAAAPVFGADDSVAKAMKLYEKRHYAEAATMLRAELPSIEHARQGTARLTLGMIYLKNAELHRKLYLEALSLHQDYLKKLAAEQGKSRSRFVDLYLGEALLASGKGEPALSYLQKFASTEGLEPRAKAMAQVSIGLCFALKGDMQKADEAWAGLPGADPEVKAALAAAYSKAGLKDRKPLQLANESLEVLKKSGPGASLRYLTNVASVYAAEGLADKGIDLFKRADLKAYSYKEAVSKAKIITFYDAFLLDDLAQLYLMAGIASLEKALEDGKIRDTVNFYLGEAYAQSGAVDQSVKSTAAFIASSMPQQYRDKAAARQAANNYRKGRQFDAIGVWDELSKKQPLDPELLAEILIVCSGVRADCPKLAAKAAASVEAGEGRRFSLLNIALGRYYSAKKDFAKAASYLETGRDKSNKNKIEFNDPEMLVNLAEAYYRTKKFSEALEIYFEMSKQFPEVRQLQEALQGIYAMEHKSAGDVKIY